MGVYSPEKRRGWEEHIRKWEASGVSQVEYCRQNDVNIKSFRYWKRRICGPRCLPALVELPPSKILRIPDSPAHSQLCLIIDRYRVEIGKGFVSEDLERVIRVLGRI